MGIRFAHHTQRYSSASRISATSKLTPTPTSHTLANTPMSETGGADGPAGGAGGAAAATGAAAAAAGSAVSAGGSGSSNGSSRSSASGGGLSAGSAIGTDVTATTARSATGGI